MYQRDAELKGPCDVSMPALRVVGKVYKAHSPITEVANLRPISPHRIPLARPGPCGDISKANTLHHLDQISACTLSHCYNRRCILALPPYRPDIDCDIPTHDHNGTVTTTSEAPHSGSTRETRAL
jgi:hypothetical protein